MSAKDKDFTPIMVSFDEISYNKLEKKAKEKLDYLVKLTPYMTPRITEKHLIDETEIPEQPLFIENTMVVTDQKYKEMEEEGRIDKDGNIIPQMLPDS